MRTLPLLLLMCCVAGCAVLPDSLRPSFREHSNSPLQNEVERLLAELYFNHPGEEQQQARRWLQQAANLGSAPAQYRLGVSYLEGSGGPADPVEAYVWLSLALLNGEQRARAGVEQLAGQLSPAQLAAARQRINTSAAPGRPF